MVLLLSLLYDPLPLLLLVLQPPPPSLVSLLLLAVVLLTLKLPKPISIIHALLSCGVYWYSGYGRKLYVDESRGTPPEWFCPSKYRPGFEGFARTTTISRRGTKKKKKNACATGEESKIKRTAG